MSQPPAVAVVGSGFGGLSSACYLADAGFDVTVLEKNDCLGGRASVLKADGFKFDMGPSWYLMPDVFERFFGHFGHEPSDFYELERLDPHYRIFFKDGDTVDVTSDREEMYDLFESYEPGAGDALDGYLDTSEEHYGVAMEQFIYTDRPRVRDWIDLDVMRAAPIGLQLLGTMDDYVADYFDHPKLRQIMQYTLVFLGGAPNNTPAIYNMMGHVDFNLGVYYPENGLQSVVDACVELGEDMGVNYVTDAEVTEILNRRGGFTVESDAGAFEADYVVSNADYAHTERELLPDHERQYDDDYWESRTYSPSAFLLYLGVEGDVEPLEHHTLVLPTDWDEHFEQIFDDPTWPEDPAYYLCVPSKTDDSVAPEGHSNLFALVPIAPGLEDTEEVRTWYRDLVLDDVAEHTGVELRDRIVFEEQFSVSEFADRYNSMQGTALGLAHTLRQTALFRPSRRSDASPGLYYTGSYTTPGIGVPMCLISGEHTANALIDDTA
ncbi:NAD(P)/FAD-dependent oxidoreductase [Natronomonas sp. LN261]|jgi:phytoene desaturase|uniref:phytoene desaturase family protein n=1 Tax=Natronomonas sp. LN261 TaxID=2750669 RepID=UPI0015EEF511|nr:phytoene desaturase family protein [Natronomonas sp. LN261]